MAEQTTEPTAPRGVDPVRVLTKVQADPTGALLVRLAAQECVIEDQEEAMAALRAELVAATSGAGGDSTVT